MSEKRGNILRQLSGSASGGSNVGLLVAFQQRTEAGGFMRPEQCNHCVQKTQKTHSHCDRKSSCSIKVPGSLTSKGTNASGTVGLEKGEESRRPPKST